MMTVVKGGTAPACAACKFQRRKCSPNCPLAPYFPISKTQDFQNVHRLFGVSNVTKTILKLQTKNERDDAMTSIIFEARMRKLLPVHGSAGIVVNLFKKLELVSEELHRVLTQLEACREPANRQAGQFAIGPNHRGRSTEARHLFGLNNDFAAPAFNQFAMNHEMVLGSSNHASSSNVVTTAFFRPEFANIDQIMGDENLAYLSSLDPWSDEVKYNNTMFDTFK